MIFLFLLAALDPTLGVLIAALVGMLASVLPGTIAYRRLRSEKVKSADRENFQALVKSWEIYAAEQQERAAKLEHRCSSLELELMKVRQDLWQLHNESTSAAQKYEAIIAQLKATLQ